MQMLDFLKIQLIQTRDYTRNLLDQTDLNEWFVMPGGAPTHLAWQVGHLAMAQFRLCLYFVRPVTDADRAVISPEFIAHFRKGSQPSADPSAYPPAAEIRRTFDAVHDHILAGWSDYAAMDLDAPAGERPHPIARTKLLSLAWAPRHEMIHAGQIALLRRMLGGAPLW